MAGDNGKTGSHFPVGNGNPRIFRNGDGAGDAGNEFKRQTVFL